MQFINSCLTIINVYLVVNMVIDTLKFQIPSKAKHASDKAKEEIEEHAISIISSLLGMENYKCLDNFFALQYY